MGNGCLRRHRSPIHSPLYSQAHIDKMMDRMTRERERQLSQILSAQSQTSRSFSSRRKDMMVENFSGVGEDWGDYLGKFENAARWNEWDEGDKLCQLVGHLQGNALALQADNRPPTYKALIKLLDARYTPSGSEETYKLKFRNKMLPPGGEPEVYAQELQRLARRAFPLWDSTHREEQVIDQFKNGIQDLELRRYVTLGGYKGLDKIITATSAYLRFNENSAGGHVKPGRKGTDGARVATLSSVRDGEMTDSVHTNSVGRAEFATMQKSLNRLCSLVTNNSSRYSSNKGGPSTSSGQNRFRGWVCWCCNEEGHIYRNCPKNRDNHYKPTPGENAREITAQARRERMAPEVRTPVKRPHSAERNERSSN